MTNLIILGFMVMTNYATVYYPDSNSIYRVNTSQEVCCTYICTDIGTTNGYLYSTVTKQGKCNKLGWESHDTFAIGHYADRAKLYARKEEIDK